MTLEKKYQGDLGRDKSWLINEVGDVTDICFDAASKKIIVARNKASQTAIVDVSNIVQITRPFQSEEHKYVHHCFLKDGQLYEVAKILGGYEISRLDLDKVAINKQFRLATGDSLISMVPISSGAIAGLFTNRNRDLVQLRLFDDGISEKTTFDLHLDIPIQLWPLPDGRLVVEGVDGIEMISFEGYKAKKQTVIRLPYPVKRKKHEPTPVFGPSR
jgi:hypothetical protein